MGDHIYTIQPPQNIINCPLRFKLGVKRAYYSRRDPEFSY